MQTDVGIAGGLWIETVFNKVEWRRLLCEFDENDDSCLLKMILLDGKRLGRTSAEGEAGGSPENWNAVSPR